jgi:putative endonuclease
MKIPRIQLGKNGESIAARHLEQHGYRILTRNYRSPAGEIDLVARQGETIVFVEVKTRRSQRFGHPKTAVTPAKQRKISMAALYYLKSKNQLQARSRFDVVTILPKGDSSQIELIQNAFELAYE